MSEIIDYCTGGISTVPSDETANSQQFTLQGDLLGGANQEAASMPESRAGTFRRLRVLVLENTSGTVTVKLVRHGPVQPNPTLKVTIENNETGLFEDNSHSVPCYEGSKYRYRVTLEEWGETTRLGYISMQLEFNE